MRADILARDRAEDRVGHCMKPDVGITVPFKSMTMRDFYPADPQRLVGHQTVDIISHADRGSHRANPQESRENRHILGICQFMKAGIAGHRNTHFRKLEWIRRGDEIVLSAPGGEYGPADETTRAAVVDAASARALMLAQPSVIKRPVVQWADGITVGFDAEAWQSRC